MSELDARKARILDAVIRDYIVTVRPVGSERLLEVYQLGCKSATIRNEMAELVELGYIVQPHTSAGRIPTDLGYRFYVDELMETPNALPLQESQQATDLFDDIPSEIESVLIQTCRMLSSLTSTLSIATDPITETTLLHRVYLTQGSARHILVVALLSTGHVEHRLVEMDTVPTDNVLVQIANFVNTLVGEREMTDAAHRLNTLEAPSDIAAHTHILNRVVLALSQILAQNSERRVFLEGSSQILRQPEFQDVQRLELLLSALEQKHSLLQALSRALAASETTIIIGTENDYAPMQTCSVITAPYHIGERRAGYLGVIGPTRMNYDRATAAVGLMATSLSQALTHLSLA